MPRIRRAHTERSRTKSIRFRLSQTLGVGWLALQTPVHEQVVLDGQVEASKVVMGGGSFHILAVVRSFKMIFKYAINLIKSIRFRSHRPLMLAGLHCADSSTSPAGAGRICGGKHRFDGPQNLSIKIKLRCRGGGRAQRGTHTPPHGMS